MRKIKNHKLREQGKATYKVHILFESSEGQPLRSAVSKARDNWPSLNYLKPEGYLLEHKPMDRGQRCVLH